MDRVVVTGDCQPNVWGKLGVAEAHAWRQDLRKEEGIQRALVGI